MHCTFTTIPHRLSLCLGRTWESFPVARHALKFHSSLQLEYRDAACFSSVQGFDSRRVISRFACEFDGLHVDTVCLAAVKLGREDRVCRVCHSVAMGR